LCHDKRCRKSSISLFQYKQALIDMPTLWLFDPWPSCFPSSFCTEEIRWIS
jgi:hypothetical protein